MKTTKNTLLVALALALAVSASPAAAQADFSKFVVVGASVDAGFIDSCWVKHGQTDSWPAIFARQAGVSGFQQPIIGEPGLGPCQILTSLAPTFSYAPNTGKPREPDPRAALRQPGHPGLPGRQRRQLRHEHGTVPCKNALIDLVLRGSGATVLQQAASLKPTFFAIGVLGNELLGAGHVGHGHRRRDADLQGGLRRLLQDDRRHDEGGPGRHRQGHRGDASPTSRRLAVLHGRLARSSASTRRRALRSTSSGRRAARPASRPARSRPAPSCRCRSAP